MNDIASNYSEFAIVANKLVSDGIGWHKKGALEKAADFYQQALAVDAKNSDAMHLSGMVLHQVGEVEQGIEEIKSAIKLNNNVAVYHNNLGTLFFEQEDYIAANNSFLNALQIKPSYVEAKFNLANSYRLTGELGLAEIYYRRTLDQIPDLVFAINGLADIYVTQNRLDDAVSLFENAITNLAGERAEDIQTMLVELYMQQASQLNYVEAEPVYRKIVNINNCDPSAHFNLGVALKEQGDNSNAIIAFKSALKLDSKFIDAAYNVGNIYKDSGCLEEALSNYKHVLTVKPNHYGSLVNSGVVTGWLGEFEKSLNLFLAAEQCQECNYVLLNNLGMVLQNLNRVDEANSYYEKALIDNPSSYEVRWNYSLSLLLSGEFKKGWEYYESRWDSLGHENIGGRSYPKPQWKGERVEGKTVFVFAEQGYGDTLQFCRLLPELIKRGANVIFECPGALMRLLHTLHKDIEIIQSGNAIPKFDLYSPLLSLNIGLNIDESNIPSITPYLYTGEKYCGRWEPYIDSKRLNVGIVWAGNPRNNSLINNVVDKRRSCSPSYLSPLFEIEEINFINLQKDFLLDKFEEKYFIQNPMPQCRDFYDTASLIEQLDLVISVDTAVAHVAGALNKPVWLLSRYDGCWRWLIDRDDSPWYPSMKLFRQKKPGDWLEVFSRVKQELLKVDLRTLRGR